MITCKWRQPIPPGRWEHQTAGSGIDEGIAQYFLSRFERIPNVNGYDDSYHAADYGSPAVPSEIFVVIRTFRARMAQPIDHLQPFPVSM